MQVYKKKEEKLLKKEEFLIIRFVSFEFSP